MSRPLPPHDSAERARHGGTTPPSRASVWDLTAEPEPVSAPTEVPTDTVPEDPVEHPIEPPDEAESPGGGQVASLVIAAIAVAVIVGGWFLLTARTSDAGSTSDAPPAVVVPTDAPPSISELAAQGGAVDAADKFAAGPTAAPESTVPAVAATLPEMAAVLTTAPEPTVPTIPTATVPEPTVPAGPRVEIVTRTEPCKFGSNCLVAGFVLHDFATPPGEFVCEFASGNRFTFGAGQFAVERACATGARGDSITIEVAGIRSDTVTHD